MAGPSRSVPSSVRHSAAVAPWSTTDAHATAAASRRPRTPRTGLRETRSNTDHSWTIGHLPSHIRPSHGPDMASDAEGPKAAWRQYTENSVKDFVKPQGD